MIDIVPYNNCWNFINIIKYKDIYSIVLHVSEGPWVPDVIDQAA